MSVKNRKYKTCIKCGFVGYGVKQFPHPFNGWCVSCWRQSTGRPLKIAVVDQWDEWANVKGSNFLREQRKRDKLRDDRWALWAKNKQAILITRSKIGVKQIVLRKEEAQTWDNCIDNRIYKLSQRMKHQSASMWDRKAKSWMLSLIRRRGQQQDSRFAS